MMENILEATKKVADKKIIISDNLRNEITEEALTSGVNHNELVELFKYITNNVNISEFNKDIRVGNGLSSIIRRFKEINAPKKPLN